ncbi:MAG: response regulator [Hyphomicrobiales bacterium]|nr:response regulator [Hyphomicrobiales bacterium]MCP5373607.1 response regulator [Hyphomicrobiales bacterium]
MRVLIVDDSNAMLKVIRVLLAQIGFEEVDEASDGAMALDMLRRGDYGLVISDWSMEPVSGIELLRTVRAEGAWRDLPFIMVTAETRRENLEEARAAGVSEYVLKPFDAPALQRTIARVLGTAG